MALRHLLLRFTPRLDGRWLLALVGLAVLIAAGTFIRWSGPAPPLELLALGPDGQFGDTVSIPAHWGDTATSTPDAVTRVPLILGARNLGRKAVSPDRLALSVPVRYRIAAPGARDLEPRVEAGSPLATYTLRPGFQGLEPGRIPAMLPRHDTLWLEVIIPAYYCVSVADSIPEFVPAPPPPVNTMSEVRIFYSFEGGDLGDRRTGTIAVRIDSSLLKVDLPPSPPSFDMVSDPVLAQPELGSLRRVGSRRSRCGEPESPMELLSSVWETPGGGRFITLDYGGTVRKRLYDLDGDGVIERESWAPGGDGRFTATRRAQLPIPAFLLPVAPGGEYDMARIDTLPPDSAARLDPFRRAMPGPGPVPGGALGPGVDSTRRALIRPPEATRPGAPAPDTAAPRPDPEPEPRIEEPQPLGRPLPPDTTRGGGRAPR